MTLWKGMLQMIEILSNWRFWSLIGIGLMPLWFGIIGGSWLLIKEKIDEVLHSR